MTARRAGLALILAGGSGALLATLRPWVDAGDARLTLWEITSLEAVIVATLAITATALAFLGIAAGGRDLAASAVAGLLAGVLAPLARDALDVPRALLGSGALFAAVAAGIGLAGALLVVLGGRRERPRAALVAVAAVAAGLLVGELALGVHPEVQVIR